MEINSIVSAAVVVGCFFTAGIAQTVFLKSALSDRFGQPIDMGKSLGKHRIFGDNKTWRGFVVMLPATTLMFLLTGLWATTPNSPLHPHIWTLSIAEWALLGFCAALGYALGELPNSFIKRRLGIPPGKAPKQRWLARVCFIIDQLDSIVVALAVISIMVPVDLVFWVACLTIGSILHWGFNVVLYALGIKERAA